MTNVLIRRWLFQLLKQTPKNVEVAVELGNRSWKSFKLHDRKNTDCLRETVSRNVDAKDDSGEDSERKKVEKVSVILWDIYISSRKEGC